MAILRSLSFPDAEWSGTQVGGVLAVFNGKEKPLKYEPESATSKYFGLHRPEAELSFDLPWGQQQSPGYTGNIEAGIYVFTFVEADSKANQGKGLRGGPQIDTVGGSTYIGNGIIRIDLPQYMVNPDADERWVYATTNGGTWPTLGRIARVPLGVNSFTWRAIDETDPNGVILLAEPDFTNYPFDPFRGPPPNKAYPVKMNRRLLLWGAEELESTFSYVVGSDIATWSGGDVIDHGIIGMVVYPANDNRGYLVEEYYAGSPGQIKLNKNFVGDAASTPTSNITTRICRPSGEISWSEPDDYENFPNANKRYVELSAADPETGAAVVNGRGMLFTVHKTFGLDFNVSPAVGFGSTIEISTQIGCLSHRTIQDLGGMLVWLSESGIAASSGGAPRIVSDEIRDQFDSLIREQNGRVRDAFAVHWAAKKKYMCFIPIEGDSVGCSRAIVMDYADLPGEPQFRFSIYNFSKEFTCGEIERHTVTSGDTTTFEEFPVLGDPDGYTWSFGIGDADGPSEGTTSGTVTTASTSPTILTDSSASFYTTGLGLAGMIVHVRSATDGTTQTKLIASNTADTLRLDEEWTTIPAAGDTYWIGGIEAYYDTSWSSLGGDWGQKKLHSLITTHQIESQGTVTVKVYTDFSSTPITLTNEGETFDLTQSEGRSYKKLSGRKAFHVKVRYFNEFPDTPFTLRAATLITSEVDEPR